MFLCVQPPTPRNGIPNSQNRSPIGVFIFVLAIVLVFGAAIARRATQYFRAEARVKAIRIANLPTSGAELAKWVPAVPDEKNGAFVITQGFALMRDFADARSNVVSMTNLIWTNHWSPETTAVVRGYLETNRSALDRIREGLKFEAFRYPLKYEDGFAALLPHLGKCKHAVSLMAIETALAAADGNTNEWPQILSDQLRLIQTLNTEPILISQLVRNASLIITRNAVEWALGHGAPSAEDCKLLQQSFWRIGETNLFPRTLIAERAVTLPMFRATIEDLDRMGDQDQEALSEAHLNSNSLTLYRVMGMADRDKIFYLDFMEHAIAQAGSGAPQMLDLVDDFETAVKTAKENRYIIPGMFMPAIAKSPVKFVGAQAAMRMTATAFAIERFRHAHGRLPQNLQQLVPEFMESVPIDPFDGQQMRYKTGPKGYVVYSVGEDRIDDGGAARPLRKKPRDENTYDVVFRVER